MTDTKLKASLIVVLTCSLFVAACNQSDTSSTANTPNNNAPVNPSPATSTDSLSATSPPPASPSPATAMPVVNSAINNAIPSTSTNPSAPSQSPTPNTADTPPPATVSSSGAQDFFVFTAARGALNNDAELKNENITVDVKNGVVTLTGSVTGEAKKARAIQIAGQAKDAKGVKNLLKVAPTK